jgi:hypothetical protein
MVRVSQIDSFAQSFRKLISVANRAVLLVAWC